MILTDIENVEKYENLCEGLKKIESNLHENLIEHLNAEIVLGTIKSFNSALEWLKSTFLYIRMVADPQKYKMAIGTTAKDAEQQLEALLKKSLKTLQDNGIITVSQDESEIAPTGK